MGVRAALLQAVLNVDLGTRPARFYPDDYFVEIPSFRSFSSRLLHLRTQSRLTAPRLCSAILFAAFILGARVSIGELLVLHAES